MKVTKGGEGEIFHDHESSALITYQQAAIHYKGVNGTHGPRPCWTIREKHQCSLQTSLHTQSSGFPNFSQTACMLIPPLSAFQGSSIHMGLFAELHAIHSNKPHDESNGSARNALKIPLIPAVFTSPHWSPISPKSALLLKCLINKAVFSDPPPTVEHAAGNECIVSGSEPENVQNQEGGRREGEKCRGVTLVQTLTWGQDTTGLTMHPQ